MTEPRQGAAASASNPYVGPRPFRPQEHAYFFGREREARDLLSLVIAERVTLFYAQSGAGKSSLVNTRLVPGLRDAGFVVLPVSRVGGAPPAGLATHNLYIFNLLSWLLTNPDDAARLAQLSLSEALANLASADGQHFFLTSAPAEAAPTPGAADMATQRTPVSATPEPADGEYTTPAHVLIIDQFEELLTTHAERWPARADFFRQLDEALQRDPLLWVVLVMREDFVASLDPYTHLLSDKLRTRYYMQRMGIEAAKKAIQQPARKHDRPFTDEALHALVDNLCRIKVMGQAQLQPGQSVEPVQLQVVCLQLWNNLRDRLPGPITVADLQEAGDVDRALANYYEESLAYVAHQLPNLVREAALRDWFSNRLITESGTRGLVNQGERHTGGLPNAVVQLLENQRYLVRRESRAGSVWCELTHDRFVEPILAANRAWAAAHPNPLTATTQAWLAAGRDPAKLLRSERLVAAQRYAEQNDLSQDEQSLLEASVRRQAEEREAARQAALRRRNLLLVAMVVVVALAGLTTWALLNAREADRQKQAAQAAATVASDQQREAQKQKAMAVAAQGTAEASAELAQEQLNLLEGDRLVREARTLSTQGEITRTLDQFKAALQANPKLEIDLAAEEQAVRKQAALLLVSAGETLARQGDIPGAAAKYQAALDLNPPSDAPVYVRVPAGPFQMGSADGAENEKPQHEVNLPEFWILRTEVTNGQYQECVAAKAAGDPTGCDTPEGLRANSSKLANWPVVNVTWHQAQQYAAWKGGRLPSEAEWEKACRGEHAAIYPWGDEPPTSELANYGYNEGTWTVVGSYPDGVSPYGLFDMAGNVWEWTNSLYQGYPYNPRDGREDAQADGSRALRGGSFYFSDFLLRCAIRFVSGPTYRDNHVGFRLVAPGF